MLMVTNGTLTFKKVYRQDKVNYTIIWQTNKENKKQNKQTN